MRPGATFSTYNSGLTHIGCRSSTLQAILFYTLSIVSTNNLIRQFVVPTILNLKLTHLACHILLFKSSYLTVIPIEFFKKR